MARFSVRDPVVSPATHDLHPDLRLDRWPRPPVTALRACLHESFTVDIDRPASLHFDAGCCTQYPPHLVVPTPSPPCGIHEIPAVFDLTQRFLWKDEDDSDEDGDDNNNSVQLVLLYWSIVSSPVFPSASIVSVCLLLKVSLSFSTDCVVRHHADRYILRRNDNIVPAPLHRLS